jgi:hypothetical protein
VPSTATTKPSKAATSTAAASKRACPPSRRASTPYTNKGAELAQQLAAEAATAPDSADLEAVADQLERTIAEADPRQAKALVRLLINDLRVNGRPEILPTYRIITPAVCALPSSVE